MAPRYKTLLPLIGVSLIVLYLAFTHKQRSDSFSQNYQLLSSHIYTFRQNEEELLDLIHRSVIHHYFNNDRIVDRLKKNRSGLENFLDRHAALESSYPETFALLKEYEALLVEQEDLVLRFMQSNARIKNSLSFLQSNITKMDMFTRRYQQEAMNIISRLFDIKSNFEFGGKLEAGATQRLEELAPTNPQAKELHTLLLRHMDILIKEFPRFHERVNTLGDYQSFTLLSRAKEQFEQQSTELKEALEKSFMLISLIMIAFIIALFVLFNLTHKSKARIIRLQQEREEDLKTDKLTGLLNRSALVEFVHEASNPALLLIDTIAFKNANSLIGYSGGDYILTQIAGILKEEFADRSDCRLFRIAADEFAVGIEDAKEESLRPLAKRLLYRIEHHNYTYSNFSIPIYAVIAIATQRPYLNNAQLAIETLKDNPSQKIVLFDKEMANKDKIADNIKMLQKVERALEEDNILPFFQPIVDLRTKEVVKYEALVRLKDGDRAISPFFFLDLTKKSKLYNLITKTVLEKAFLFAMREDREVTVNLSIEDVVNNQTKTFIYEFLEKESANAHRLTFELVESEQIKDYAQVIAFIKKVKEKGCQIAIDDFGSGYSNFEYLMKFEPDIIKIDGSLIKNINTDRNSRLIVLTILRFAKEAGIKTVGEFVDNSEVDRIITEMGIDYGQGYYYSPPQEL